MGAHIGDASVSLSTSFDPTSARCAWFQTSLYHSGRSEIFNVHQFSRWLHFSFTMAAAQRSPKTNPDDKNRFLGLYDCNLGLILVVLDWSWHPHFFYSIYFPFDLFVGMDGRRLMLKMDWQAWPGLTADAERTNAVLSRETWVMEEKPPLRGGGRRLMAGRCLNSGRCGNSGYHQITKN